MLLSRLIVWMFSVGIMVLGASVAPSQDYPSKPIRMLVGFAPGGNSDTVARIMALRLGERLGRQVVVENRPGAAGNIAAELTAKAAPDGYTVFMASSSHTINAALYRQLPFDPLKDFAAVTLVSSSPFVLVVLSSIPLTSVRELIAVAKSKPGQLNYASGGASSHLAAELFRSMAGISIVHIPYKSSGLAISDLLGGQVAMMFSALPAALPHVNSGRLRALGVTSSKRLSSASEIPTIAESGLAGYEVDQWSGVLAPAATPKGIIAKLNREITYVMNLSDVRERLAALGMEAKTNTSEQFTSFLEVDIRKWAKVARESGARSD